MYFLWRFPCRHFLLKFQGLPSKDCLVGTVLVQKKKNIPKFHRVWNNPTKQHSPRFSPKFHTKFHTKSIPYQIQFFLTQIPCQIQIWDQKNPKESFPQKFPPWLVGVQAPEPGPENLSGAPGGTLWWGRWSHVRFCLPLLSTVRVVVRNNITPAGLFVIVNHPNWCFFRIGPPSTWRGAVSERHLRKGPWPYTVPVRWLSQHVWGLKFSYTYVGDAVN